MIMETLALITSCVALIVFAGGFILACALHLDGDTRLAATVAVVAAATFAALTVITHSIIL